LEAELLHRENTTDVIMIGFFCQMLYCKRFSSFVYLLLVISDYEHDTYEVAALYCKYTHPS